MASEENLSASDMKPRDEYNSADEALSTLVASQMQSALDLKNSAAKKD